MGENHVTTLVRFDGFVDSFTFFEGKVLKY